MDDDITFGVSVWSSSAPISILQDNPFGDRASSTTDPFHSQPADDDFDDFDDFGPPAQDVAPSVEDDDFGDFGDFDTTESIPLDPVPSRSQLVQDIDDILGPLWPTGITEVTTDDPIREMEGISQILVTSESRNLFNMLVQSPPPTKPPNWIRSRIRHEVLPPHTGGKALPPLHITTRPMSAPPGPRGPPQQVLHVLITLLRYHTLAPKPELDDSKIHQLLALDSDTLTLQPLPTLERYLTELRQQTANTSARLTHLLQNRDALQQDAETYNGLIAELVGEAQKIKTGKGGPRTDGEVG
ncbi:uncharacterized protein EV420DRAFT_1665579 [Desarmillaria tabescens]|uniref:Uncharacterized protein n=1 Tax=Armillaria tabescens TaxID=1929756 RepID=A0AA39NAB0_ARMTA|nr:uncharacterized protein EV420DRAFT_1665579 [Desarmillaria tabescens]KAK0461942.1 hypothetical protein EV420DRAFT_1665579 [Desarmillaria tabescens]